MANQNNQPKNRVFDNPILEAIVRSNPYITAITYMSVVATLLYINYYYQFVTSWKLGLILYVSGLFTWTFFEYILHRYIFHFVSDSKFGQLFHRTVHGFHHDHPRDEEHLFMPPLPGIILSSFFTALFSIIFGLKTFVFSAGFINGYLFYAAIHYSTHKFKTPKNRFLKTLWRHHYLHHYRFPDKAFGVSSPLWDRIFGTMPPMPKKRTASKSALESTQSA